ncbi:unnamed protein product [Linum trigynum]|uniref:Uncharacterized protein n=1 Tax=Linum trigynum TaxID=586398 RepID=A0AAV2CKK1_9ROSI
MSFANAASELLIESPATSRSRSDFSERRRRALKRVDRELLRRNYGTALSVVKQLQAKQLQKQSLLRGFGTAKQVPMESSAFDGLQFDGLERSSVEALVDSVLDAMHDPAQLKLIQEVEARGPRSCEDVHLLCLQHEAGHFLVGYLIGVLPQNYQVPSVEDLRQNEVFVKSKIEFPGFGFLTGVGPEILRRNLPIAKRRGTAAAMVNRRVSSKTLNAFSCVMLGGLVAEYLAFGYSQGHLTDLQKLHNTIKWLEMEESKVEFQIKWAALNTIFILHSHQQARERLVEAMADGQSVGVCIDAIESTLPH